MKELILKNNKLGFTTVLKMNDEQEVISSTILFDESMDFSTIFPGRGILFGMYKIDDNPDKARQPNRQFPEIRKKENSERLPNWLAKDLKERKWKR
jgi:hypothetical protein